MVLYPNLPKLMEAVVKSLDPNSTMHREAVLDTATEIIGHVVKTYVSVVNNRFIDQFSYAVLASRVLTST